MAQYAIDDVRQFSDDPVYLNFPGSLEEGDDTLRTIVGPAYERAVELEDEDDPTNPSSLDQNVAPSESARTDGGRP